MQPKDEARGWLDERCGRGVHVETHFVNGTAAPLTNRGRLSKTQRAAPKPRRSWKTPLLFLTCTGWGRSHTTWQISPIRSRFVSDPNLLNSSK